MLSLKTRTPLYCTVRVREIERMMSNEGRMSLGVFVLFPSLQRKREKPGREALVVDAIRARARLPLGGLWASAKENKDNKVMEASWARGSSHYLSLFDSGSVPFLGAPCLSLYFSYPMWAV